MRVTPRGNLPNAHCEGEKPPTRDSSFLTAIHSSAAILRCVLPTIPLWRMTRFKIFLKVPPWRSPIAICSGDSSPACLQWTPCAAKVRTNTPRLCNPRSVVIREGHPYGATQYFMNAVRHFKEVGWPLPSLTNATWCMRVPTSTILRNWKSVPSSSWMNKTSMLRWWLKEWLAGGALTGWVRAGLSVWTHALHLNSLAASINSLGARAPRRSCNKVSLLPLWPNMLWIRRMVDLALREQFLQARLRWRSNSGSCTPNSASSRCCAISSVLDANNGVSIVLVKSILLRVLEKSSLRLLEKSSLRSLVDDSNEFSKLRRCWGIVLVTFAVVTNSSCWSSIASNVVPSSAASMRVSAIKARAAKCSNSTSERMFWIDSAKLHLVESFLYRELIPVI